MDSVFLRENRGHLSENLSTKNYSFGAKMRIIRRLPPNGSHPLRIPRNTRAQVKLAKSLAWPKEWGPCCVAFGRAYGSHPYGRTSHGSGPFPISSPIFRTFSSKMNVLKIRFSQLFSMKNGQYGLVAQLGERCVRIHMDLHHLSDFSFQFFVRFFGLFPQN